MMDMNTLESRMTHPDRRRSAAHWARYERTTARLYGVALTALGLWLVALSAWLVAS